MSMKVHQWYVCSIIKNYLFLFDRFSLTVYSTLTTDHQLTDNSGQTKTLKLTISWWTNFGFICLVRAWKWKVNFVWNCVFFEKHNSSHAAIRHILPLHGFAKKKLIIFVKHKSDMTISHSCNLDFLKLFLIGVNRTNKIC